MAKYNNDGVAHAWANGTDDNASNGRGTLYSRDAVIYSYGAHYPIARRYDALNIVLFNNDGSTRTTEKQKGIVRRAIPPRYTVIDVLNIEPFNDGDHRFNLSDILYRFECALELAARARTYGDLHLESVDRLRRAFIAYTQAFDIGDAPAAPTMPDNIEDIRARIALARKEKQERNKAEQLKKEQRHADIIAEWLAGEPVRMPQLDRVYMRLTRESQQSMSGQQIETSHGARFPVSDAIAGWRAVSACVARGVSWKRNGENIKLGSYQIDTISKTGTVRAGCHTVHYEQIKHVATLLGLTIESTPSQRQAASNV